MPHKCARAPRRRRGKRGKSVGTQTTPDENQPTTESEVTETTEPKKARRRKKPRAPKEKSVAEITKEDEPPVVKSELPQAASSLKQTAAALRSMQQAVTAMRSLQQADTISPLPQTGALSSLKQTAAAVRSIQQAASAMRSLQQAGAESVEKQPRGKRKKDAKQLTPARYSWVAEHILDFRSTEHRIRCLCGRARSEFVVDVYNRLTKQSGYVCPTCCVRKFYRDPECLLISLDYLANVGLSGKFVAQSGYQCKFDVEISPRIGQVIDTFRWFFIFHPFLVRKNVATMTVYLFKKPMFQYRTGAGYFMTLVAASWGRNYRLGRGVSFFVKSLI